VPAKIDTLERAALKETYGTGISRDTITHARTWAGQEQAAQRPYAEVRYANGRWSLVRDSEGRAVQERVDIIGLFLVSDFQRT
jgi:hypothetical protein